MAKKNLDQLREQIAQAREEFAAGVQGAVANNDPRVLKDRTKDSVRGFMQGEVDHVRSLVQYEDGSWKIDVIAKMVGAIVGGVIVLKLVKKLLRGK